MQHLRRVLFREPFGGPIGWFMLAVGCFSLLIGVFGIVSRGFGFPVGPNSVVLGLMFVLFGLSEILPRERKSMIVLLRLGVLVLAPAVVFVSIAAIAVEIAKV